jgi:hypothetical protein
MSVLHVEYELMQSVRDPITKLLIYLAAWGAQLGTVPIDGPDGAEAEASRDPNQHRGSRFHTTPSVAALRRRAVRPSGDLNECKQ